VEEVVKAEGAMPVAAVLRHRVRYLSDGAVLGTAAFVDGIFLREKEAGRASPKRESGARKMRGADWGELRVMRDLRKEVIRKPNPEPE